MQLNIKKPKPHQKMDRRPKQTFLQSYVFFQILTLRCGEGNGTPLQYSCLENPMDGGTWWAAVCGVAKSRPRLSNFTFSFHFHALEKEMATHSSVLAWRIPGTGEPGGLPSMGSHGVGHDWSGLAAAAAAPSGDVSFSVTIQGTSPIFAGHCLPDKKVTIFYPGI